MMDEFVAEYLKKRTKFETRIAPGLPAEQVVRLAKSEKTDMIVMGTHGRSGLKRLMIGSVTDKVIRSAPCPVLVVNSADKEQKEEEQK